MDCMYRTQNLTVVLEEEPCQLKYVNLEHHDNQVSHQTLGLSSQHLVVRRGQPFKLTLLFHGRAWIPSSQTLFFQVWLGGLSEMVPVQQIREPWKHHPGWTAQYSTGEVCPGSATFQLCSPVLSSVGLYHLVVHMESPQGRLSYRVGSFVLLCNPWLKEDSVYMPLDIHIEEYVKCDYGLVYMGTHLNVSKRPWAFGQYEPQVLEACLKLLQVSPQHLRDNQTDYIRRSDPVYLCRVLCAMVNCNDDRGVLQGNWDGSYHGGVDPSEWSGSADILTRWASSSFSPVRYGQCWVFAAVLCTVMRVLGIPCRVVTAFNAAHDTNRNLIIEEVYSATGEKLERLGLSKDSIWNFHVWVECWMKRPDLGPGFEGWQVLDPTPQERSAGIFCCGPCPVAAIKHGLLSIPYDAAFIYAAVDADVVRLILRGGLVLGRSVDSESVGRLIYTKSVGSELPENLTWSYKGSCKRSAVKQHCGISTSQSLCKKAAVGENPRRPTSITLPIVRSRLKEVNKQVIVLSNNTGGAAPSLSVSLAIEKAPAIGENICLCVTITNHSGRPRLLLEHVNAQLKMYNSDARKPFWRMHRELQIRPGEVVMLHHAISASDYESVLACSDIVNVAAVVKDIQTKERVLAMQEFNITAPQISIVVLGGDSVQVREKHTVHVAFINTMTKPLSNAVLILEGSGLFQAKDYTRAILLQPGQTMEKELSIMAVCPGTKLLMATVSHGNSHSVIAREFHRVFATDSGGN